MAPDESRTARLSGSVDSPTQGSIQTTLSKRNPQEYKWRIVWASVFVIVYIHVAALYGLYLAATQAKIATLIWALFVAFYSFASVTAGAHRLWSHKCYKAKLPLKILLAFCNATAFQKHIYEWSRDHRMHHKFLDTDADPYSSRRGFFFCHIGWLMLRKHEDVKVKGKLIDMSDLENDSVVMWQKRLYPLLVPLCAFFIPTWVPCYFWGENAWTSWYVAGMLRYTYTLHTSFVVNSLAHMYGTKPYDRSISSTENLYVGILAFGEGWHNYHHAFPWDYKISEFSGYRTNFTTGIIDFFAWIGWAYDLKTVKTDMIVKRAKRTGDGSHPSVGKTESTDNNNNNGHHHNMEEQVWGWDDKDMTNKEMAAIINPGKSVRCL